MKPFKLIFLSTLISFLSLHAEESAMTESAIDLSVNDESVASSIDEELSLFDEEFEEFQEELFSLEEDLKREEAQPMVTAPTEPLQALLAQEGSTEPPPVELLSAPTEVKHVELFTDTAAKQDSPALPLEEEPAALITIEGEIAKQSEVIKVDLQRAFAGSPIIYVLLFGMSVFAVCIWLYSLLSLRGAISLPSALMRNLHDKLNSNHFDDALFLCQQQNNLFCKMVATGIHSRRHGLPMMIEAMKAEGKRLSVTFWQRLGLLNDIAIIAPMLGLLGTVLGMFYAFYDINRSIESISTLFDGLGISVGTTVAGLVVAILALVLHSMTKYRLVRALAHIENEAQGVATMIDDRTSLYKGYSKESST